LPTENGEGEERDQRSEISDQSPTSAFGESGRTGDATLKRRLYFLGFWGGSYGGFLTAMGLARNSDVFKAGVEIHGVHDWAIFLPMWAGEVDAKNAEVAPDIKEARELAFKSSPVANIANWRSPVLLVHGDDRAVPRRAIFPHRAEGNRFIDSDT
jgi:prolyl oligopeptidase PreP (S9A serine peptidase family)